MEKSELMSKITKDEDFIHAPKYGNSLSRLLAKTDNLLENNAIARLLLISSDDVERIYQESIEELRKEMCPDGRDV